MTSKAERVEAKRQQHAADEHELDLFLNAPHHPAGSPASCNSDAALTAENDAAAASESTDEVPPRGSTDTGALLPGLVILKGFLSPQQQKELVNDSRRMGMGEGGFYKPTYASGAKCRLHQMCLGRHWNVKSEKYEDRRSNHDNAPVPALPESWKVHAQRSLDAARGIDPQVMGSCKQMTPDICVVNFYKKAGRNGMHIDKDESNEAMVMGSPVISFSIGCAAEFAYIDHYPEPHEAVPIVRLESGDALVFGGPARNVVHALTRVYNNTQPAWLRMRSGRLNLTFREYKPSELLIAQYLMPSRLRRMWNVLLLFEFIISYNTLADNACFSDVYCHEYGNHLDTGKLLLVEKIYPEGEVMVLLVRAMLLQQKKVMCVVELATPFNL
ncbi:unnamed protein product [Phytophthora fragariaefolia]|uniref:Unnamed protein product n=1 Tax=Phytophthora fragariaefolia TaxID=1490495 RepID=A0A9W6XGK3_9STRA|nr:unnamed protein product [Phytophthora fragariaefolia]